MTVCRMSQLSECHINLAPFHALLDQTVPQAVSYSTTSQEFEWCVDAYVNHNCSRGGAGGQEEEPRQRTWTRRSTHDAGTHPSCVSTLAASQPLEVTQDTANSPLFIGTAYQLLVSQTCLHILRTSSTFACQGQHPARWSRPRTCPLLRTCRSRCSSDRTRRRRPRASGR
jgi:hypothetical protein